jgi:5'-nucleotidase
MEERPLILISNDDGVFAKGMTELIEVIRLFGNIVVVAPDSPHSGMSHAITVERPIRVTKLQEEEGLTVYSCSGTPVDCVKLACSKLLSRLPDFVISGINHGANTSISVLYSGTMGAAIEGSIHGIPSIGFSLDDYTQEADFTRAKKVVARIFQKVAEFGLPDGICLNVNIPKGEVKGINFTRQTRGKWMEEFEKRTDPHGRDYYWMTGYFNDAENEARDTDTFALLNGFVSVVPVTTDLTAYSAFHFMQKWKF